MAHKNCLTCKHHKSSSGACPEGYVLIDEREDYCLGAHYGFCEAGNNDVMKRWWNNTGSLPVDEAEDLDCFCPTELDETLARAIALLDKMIDTE